MNSECTEEYNRIAWSPGVYPHVLLLTAYCGSVDETTVRF
jgi:hypothetical protein